MVFGSATQGLGRLADGILRRSKRRKASLSRSQRRIIVHMGRSKTGSSAIQANLTRMRGELLRHGFEYPVDDYAAAQGDGQIGSGNAFWLAQAFRHGAANMSHARRETVLNSFRDKIESSQGHVILSSEYIASLSIQNLVNLYKFLSEMGTVEFVLFIRHQVMFIAASYIQNIKRGVSAEFPEEFFQDWQSFQKSLNYYSYLERLTTQMPDVKLTVQPYENSIGRDGGIFELFVASASIKIPLDKLPPNKLVNISPPPKYLRFLIEANRGTPSPKFSDTVLAAMARDQDAIQFAVQNIVPPDVRKDIVAYFAPSNEKLFRKYFNQDNMYDLALVGEEFESVRDVPLGTAEHIQIVTNLMLEFDDRLRRMEKAVTRSRP